MTLQRHLISLSQGLHDMGKVSDFFTRDAANEGVKIPLLNPRTGGAEWIKILGIDSDIFREAKINKARQLIKIAEIDNDGERAEAIKEADFELLSVLVADWSFDTPCEPDEIINVLRNAPQIAEVVDTKAGARSLFLQKKSRNSKATQKRSSSSQKSRKDKRSAGGKRSDK